MNRFQLLAIAIGAVLAGGCATTDKKQAAADDDDKTYVTGSRIPVKDKNAINQAKQTSDRNAIDGMLRRGATSSGSGGQ